MATTIVQNPTWPRDGYDPEWLALEDAMGGRFILPSDISKASGEFDTTFAAISKMWPPIEEPLDIYDDNTGPDHGNMPVRIYRPKFDKPLPLMVHFPGGGFFSGTLDTEDYQARYYSAKTPCVVVSVNYPLAPQYNIDQIIAYGVMGVEWSRAQAPAFSADPTRTILCGGSAGSFLAEQVTYHFMSTGQHDVVSGCILMYTGAVHWTYQGPYKHMHRSWIENGHSQVPLLGEDEANSMWSGLGFRPEDPKHFVFMAEDLSKFPPSYLVSAGKCCFRDGGIMLQHRLREAGVRCKYDFYPGLPHWFHAFPQLSASHKMNENTIQGARFLLEK